MNDRKQERYKTIYYLRVYDAESDEYLGRMVDVSDSGMMLISEEPVMVGRVYNLRIDIPDVNDDGSIRLKACAVRSCNDTNPDFYDTGMEFIHPDEKCIRLIHRLESELSFT